jgi:hypothetical protein
MGTRVSTATTSKQQDGSEERTKRSMIILHRYSFIGAATKSLPGTELSRPRGKGASPK